MAACWRIEPGARDAQDLVVQVYVRLNRDGSVLVANIVDNSRFTTDPFYRSAAENARRAILSCQPFELPPKRYEVWREMTLNFNPSEHVRRMTGSVGDRDMSRHWRWPLLRRQPINSKREMSKT